MPKVTKAKPQAGPPSLAPDASQKELLAAWDSDLHKRVIAYDKGSTLATGYNTVGVIITGIASALAALSIFASAEKSGSVAVRIAAGILTVVVTATAFIQSNVAFANHAKDWRGASVALAGIRRQVQRLGREAEAGAVDEKRLDAVSEAWGQAEAAVDSPYQKAWDYATAQMKNG